MKLFKKLNQVGAAHFAALAVVVVGIAAAGTYALVASHADPVAYRYYTAISDPYLTVRVCKANNNVYLKVYNPMSITERVYYGFGSTYPTYRGTINPRTTKYYAIAISGTRFSVASGSSQWNGVYVSNINGC